MGRTGLPDFFDAWYQNRKKCTKWTQYVPEWSQNIHKIFQMAVKCIYIFHSDTLKIFPKLGFLVWKQTIWQPWLELCSIFFLFGWSFQGRGFSKVWPPRGTCFWLNMKVWSDELIKLHRDLLFYFKLFVGATFQCRLQKCQLQKY
jgi:hypothetical protein